MKVIVTGAAGFIGSTLSEKLLEKGYDVTGIDCFTPHYPLKIKKNNIKILRSNKKFTFIEKDLLKLDLKKTVRDAGYVFHLAAQAGVRASWGGTFETYLNNNILATQLLLEVLKDNKQIEKLVFASSSSVYGDAPGLPVKETTMPLPVSPYGVTKLAAEQMCSLYFKNYGIPVVSLRYFTVYGPRQRPDMAFNIFIRNILNGKSLPVFNGGKSTRDFTYVDDIVNGNILAAESRVNGEVFNIGGGSRISLNEVITIIGEIMGKKPKINIEGFQKGDVRDTWADISKAKKILGYEPKVKIREGLIKEVEFLKSC